MPLDPFNVTHRAFNIHSIMNFKEMCSACKTGNSACPSPCIPGTYNSQYMVVDLSRVSLGHSIRSGALTVVEQIPGKVMHSDQTQALRRGKRLAPAFSCLPVSGMMVFHIIPALFAYLYAAFARLLAVVQHTISR